MADDKDQKGGQYVPDDTDGKVAPISSAPSHASTNGQAAIETDAEGFIGRDLATKATKKPPRIKTVTFPGWTEWAGAKYRIKEIRGGDYSRVQSSLVKGKGADQRVDTTEQDARLIIAASVNKDGSPMWTKNDLQTVMDFPASVSEFLVEEIRNLFQKPKDAEDEDRVGNSTGTASRG